MGVCVLHPFVTTNGYLRIVREQGDNCNVQNSLNLDLSGGQ